MYGEQPSIPSLHAVLVDRATYVPLVVRRTERLDRNVLGLPSKSKDKVRISTYFTIPGLRDSTEDISTEALWPPSNTTLLALGFWK